MPSEKRRPEPPERLGPYRLDQLLGSGGMGEVWRAWDERLDRWVALKQIRADTTLRHGRERLRREARAVARLSHPAIVHVYDILEGADGDWIVMELVEGRTLRRLLDEEAALPPARAVRLCREITEGLAEAHAHGILHRDLKASNVIVGPSGRAKILDFGLAKEIPSEREADSQDLTGSAPGVVLGTCFAMSPEQALAHPLDERSDLFSLGSLLYEMLTGEAPFRAATPALSLAKVVHREVPPLHETNPTIPAAICDLVDWLLQKAPPDRPQSAAAVLAALEGAVRSQVPPPGLDPAASTLVEPARPAGRPASGEELRQSGGERRTVTIVCCSLVQTGRSAGQAGALDVEILSEATAAFESLGREVCRELSGSLGAVLNRMLWLCFGYPRAHEDDPERAVRAARELQKRFTTLPVAAAHRLAVSAGLHTGPAVVVTRPSSGQSLQPGDTFDIAMAVQGQVAAGRLGVSAASRQLLGRRFATHPLAAVHVKGLDATVDVYELGSSVEPGSRESDPSGFLVGREAELRILVDRYHLVRLVRSGEGQAVLIAGEAGIGKSRLVAALAERLEAEAPVWLAVHGSTLTQNTPLVPIVHLLTGTLFGPGDSAEGSGEERLRRLEEILDEHGLSRPDYAPLLGALLSLPIEGRYPPLVLSPEVRRKRTLAAVLALLGAIAERRPLVLVVEDLHWIDSSTLELLDLLLGELPVLPLLLVATFRPEFSPPWRHQTSVTQLHLRGLSEPQAAELIERVSEGKRLPAEMRQEILARTDGIPLFIEELTKTVLEGDAPAGIPLTLGGWLLARLDRLGEAKAVAQLASVLGRTFTLEQLEALSWVKGAALRAALDQLLQAEILYRRGPAPRARYIFKHALIQDAAYLSLLAADRQQLHRRLVHLLQEEFPAVAEAEPELMAYHCEHGGLRVEAVDYLLQAGQRALRRSAALEAVSHITRALDLLLALPEAPERLERELLVRSALGAVLPAIKGWGDPEVGANAERCVALCRELGDRERLIPSLYALWDHHLLRDDGPPTIDLSAEIARLAETPVEVFIGCSAQAQTAFERGRFAEVLALTEQATALFEPTLHPELAQVFGEESSLMPHLFHFWALAVVGRPDAAVRRRDVVLAAVETQSSPFLLSVALTFEMILWHQLLSPERAAGAAERLRRTAEEQEFALLLAFAHVGQGWAACHCGDLAAGAAQIEKGLELQEATGAQLLRRYMSGYLVEAYLAAGRTAEGLATVRRILVRPEDRFGVSLDSELLRLEGELLRASGDAAAAEVSFRKALGIARDQGARIFELRTATSLGRLLVEQGREAEALSPLAAIYQTYTEGFETRDLQEARKLLDRLAPRPRVKGGLDAQGPASRDSLASRD